MRPSSFLLLVPLLACVGCQSTAVPGSPCTRGSDCTAPLVCAYGRCRAECVASRDCPAGSRCIASAGAGICTLDVENHCDGQVCPAPLACVADQCRTACAGPGDCLAGRCESASCVEPIAGTDAGPGEDAGDVDAAQVQDRDAAGGADAGLEDAAGLDAAPTDAASASDAWSEPRDAYRPDAGNCPSSPCPGEVVISEVYPGLQAGFFVELYVPGGGDLDLSGCIVTAFHRTTAAHEVTLPSGSRVSSHGYYAVGDSASADLRVSTTTLRVDAAHGAVALSCAGLTIDEVGWGSNLHHEGAALPNPTTGQSLERRASASSTASTLGPGGAEEHAGNGYDGGDNATDFVAQGQPLMQSRASALEPP